MLPPSGSVQRSVAVKVCQRSCPVGARLFEKVTTLPEPITRRSPATA
jgi:hypothetical protein